MLIRLMFLVVASAYEPRGPEGLVYRLTSMHTYNLSVSYFGSYEYVMCETLQLKVAIAPEYSYSDMSFCTGYDSEVEKHQCHCATYTCLGTS